MHAFIVRPFGTKNGINFDRVERELIGPALQKLKLSGGTTAEIIEQGNIREDMFEQLLIADLVVADISIHNANAFYELGIRHAFRDKRTLLIKSKGDDVPFDLKTDRYLLYDADNPAGSLDALVAALKATVDSQSEDSPVFQLLPGLKATDPSKFLVVPLGFREGIEQAAARKGAADLQLLASEADGFAWRTAGLRLVGEAQFRIRDLQGAKATWEAVRTYDDGDLQANTILGTVYQKLGHLVKSDQALDRALERKDTPPNARAELQALKASNAKTLWRLDWEEITEGDARQSAALGSAHLERSFELYCKGFAEDRNHFYSGLNALAMGTVTVELARAQPETWEDGFDSPEEAALRLKKINELHSDFAAGVRLGIESKRVALERESETDIWAEISDADLTFLTSSRSTRVARAYQKALANAPDFAREVARSQLLLYEQLGILGENTAAALAAVGGDQREHRDAAAKPRVILFTGHRIDAPGRETPRFPPDKEEQARAMIAEAVSREKDVATGEVLGISGGASGGDILFHEVCEELAIPTQAYLVIPEKAYIKDSVADAGPQWVERFNRLLERDTTDELRPRILSETAELPRWLRSKRGYSIWQRSNLWMLHNALAISEDNVTLIALWNGQIGDGPGGTEDMVQRAQDRGAKFIHLDARKLIE